MHHPTYMIIHSILFVTPVVEHWLEREIAHWVHHEGSIRWPTAPWANTLTTELHLAPCWVEVLSRDKNYYFDKTWSSENCLRYHMAHFTIQYLLINQINHLFMIPRKEGPRIEIPPPLEIMYITFSLPQSNYGYIFYFFIIYNVGL